MVGQVVRLTAGHSGILIPVTEQEEGPGHREQDGQHQEQRLVAQAGGGVHIVQGDAAQHEQSNAHAQIDHRHNDHAAQ